MLSLKLPKQPRKIFGAGREGREQLSVVCRRAWSAFPHTVVIGCLGGASHDLCAAGAHSQAQRGCSNLESCQWMSELLWHAQDLFQFTDPCRCWGVRPSQPSVDSDTVFPVGIVVRGASFEEEFPFYPSFITCLLQPNGERGSSIGNESQSFGILIRSGSTNCYFGRGLSPAARATKWWVRSVPGWRSDGVFGSLLGGHTVCGLLPS